MNTTSDNISQTRQPASSRKMSTPIIAVCLVIAIACAYAAFFIPPLVETTNRAPVVGADSEAE